MKQNFIRNVMTVRVMIILIVIWRVMKNKKVLDLELGRLLGAGAFFLFFSWEARQGSK